MNGPWGSLDLGLCGPDDQLGKLFFVVSIGDQRAVRSSDSEYIAPTQREWLVVILGG